MFLLCTFVFIVKLLHIRSEAIALRAIADEPMGRVRAVVAALEWAVRSFDLWYFSYSDEIV